VLVEATPDRVPEHVVAKHVGEVIEAARPDHAVVEVCPGLVIPIVQPAAVQLVENFLFGSGKVGVVVL
jgi:hypothetical protein